MTDVELDEQAAKWLGITLTSDEFIVLKAALHAAKVQATQPFWCSQCGHHLWSNACGPTHAMRWHNLLAKE